MISAKNTRNSPPRADFGMEFSLNSHATSLNSAICVCSRLTIISVELPLTSDLRFRLSRHLKFPFPAQSSELDSTELQGGGRNKEVIRYRLGGGMIEEEPTTPDWSRPRPNSPLSSLSLSRLSGLSLASNTSDKLDILEAK